MILHEGRRSLRPDLSIDQPNRQSCRLPHNFRLDQIRHLVRFRPSAVATRQPVERPVKTQGKNADTGSIRPAHSFPPPHLLLSLLIPNRKKAASAVIGQIGRPTPKLPSLKAALAQVFLIDDLVVVGLY
jgi:hypothetical protein